MPSQPSPTAPKLLSDPSIPIHLWTVSQPWLEHKMHLGEGPYYEASTHSVRWVDVLGKKIWWAELVDHGDAQGKVRNVRSVDVLDCVGVTSDIHGDDDNIIVAAKYGFALVEKQSGKMTYLCKVYDEGNGGEGEEKAQRMRFNDGAVDSRGRFWAGSMTDNALYPVENEGTMFRLDALSSDLRSNTVRVSRHMQTVMIPNGIAWSPIKHGVFYHTDSPTRTISEYDFDEASGTVTNKRPWFVLDGSIEIPAQSGSEKPELFRFNRSMVPDGCQFDVEGNLWTAIWGAGMVLRIKDLGDRRIVTGVVRVPARCSSCCRFMPGGGMVITSASEEQTEKFGDGGPGAGKLFWVNVGVEGAETWKFGRRSNGTGDAAERSKI